MPAGDDHDPAQVADLELGHAERLEHERVAADAVADRLAHRLRLLVDLLEHERLVAALLGALLVPVELLPLGRSTSVPSPKKRTPSGVISTTSPSRGWMTARVSLRNAAIERGEEVLAVAEPDDERRLMSDADEQVGLVVVDRDDREVPFELRVDAAERLREIAVVLLLEQVDDDLGVGLGRERVTALGQLRPQLAVVLDDPVEDDREAAGSQPVSGCAFCSVTAPCVAQRVWPSP